jgi:integrase
MTTLTVKRIAILTKPGRYRDPESRGLYLQVGKGGTKSWLLRYELGGRERLGDFTLKEARERAREKRQLLADGIDPIEKKRIEKAAKALEDARALTFEEAARQYYAAHEASWSNRKHRQQFLNTMRDYVFPKIGKLSVAAIDTGLVLKAVEGLWQEKAATANKVRGRIERVLDWATVRGYRTGDNPARWRGHLDQVLPAASAVSRPEHHRALPYAELSAFVAELRGCEGVAARALEFTILTAARTGETVGATWDEIDIKACKWVIPAERMKNGRGHTVPLSDRVVELLEALPTEQGNPHVFIGTKPSARISHAAMLRALRRLRADIDVHGFRAVFSTWAHECSAFPNHVIEQALAHTVGNAVERAYRRGDLFEKRRRLMTDWAKYCYSPPAQGKVVPIRTA